MSDDDGDTPLEFPDSEPDYYPEVVKNDDEREKSPYKWQSECLQLMADHGLSPEDLEDESEEQPEEPEPEGE
jgi:hypothetical protein